MRGALYYQQKKYPLAKADFEKVHENPDLRFEREKYSYLYTALGTMSSNTNPKKSLEYFLKAVEYYPVLGNYENVGIAFQKVKNYKKAETYFIKCLEIKEHPKFYMHLVSLYYNTKEYQKGIEYLSKGIKSGINSPVFYKMRCYFYIEEKNYEKAKLDYDKVESLLKNKAVLDTELQSLKKKLDNKYRFKQ